MKRELGIDRCGRVCCLCSENVSCAFTEFARRYGEECFLECLERNESKGIISH